MTVSRRRVAGLHLLRLQGLINVFSGLRKVLYSDLDRLTFQCSQLIDQYLLSGAGGSVRAFLHACGLWAEVVLSACSKVVKHFGIMKSQNHRMV